VYIGYRFTEFPCSNPFGVRERTSTYFSPFACVIASSKPSIVRRDRILHSANRILRARETTQPQQQQQEK
jgi:hypothetical protein